MPSIISDLQAIQLARNNIKNALEGKGQSPTNDIRTYASLISAIPQSSSQIKLFNTEEELNAYTGANEDDLAIVYREETKPITANTEFSKCIFPSTVVLTQTVSDEIYGFFESTEGNYFDGMLTLSNSYFSFDVYTELISISIMYTSSDGLTYTRTSGTTEQDFGTIIKWNDGYGTFDNVIGNFMKVDGTYFGGLFSYSNTLTKYVGGKLETAIIDGNNVTYTETLQYNKDDIEEFLDYCRLNFSDEVLGVVLGINAKKLIIVKNTNSGGSLSFDLSNSLGPTYQKWINGTTMNGTLILGQYLHYNIWDIDNKSFDLSEFEEFTSEVQDTYNHLYHLFGITSSSYTKTYSTYYTNGWVPMTIDYKIYGIKWIPVNN